MIRLMWDVGLSYIHCYHLLFKEYFREPWRGYGGSVVEVFTKLKSK